MRSRQPRILVLVSALLSLMGCGPGLKVPSCNLASTWRTIDDWIPSPTVAKTTIANALTVDSGNSVFVGAYLTDGFSYVRKGEQGGSYWSVVDTFQYLGIGSQITNLWVDPIERVWAQGVALDGTGSPQNWYMRSSSDNGATWTTTDLYQLSAGNNSRAWLNNTGILVDSNGHWYAGGQGDTGGSSRWLVRKSTDRGTTWSLVLNYQYLSGFNGGPRALTQDSSGTLYLAGVSNDAAGYIRAIVLKSADRGANWTLADDYLPEGISTGTGYKAIIAINSNTILAGGAGADSTGALKRLIRKSVDNGVTWTTVEYPTEVSSIQSDFLFDRRGYLYTSGFKGTAPNRIPTIWRSTDEGNSWTEVDSLVGDNLGLSSFRAMALGPDGSVYATAQTVESSSFNHVITRKLACW
jgi:hypothetical protein